MPRWVSSYFDSSSIQEEVPTSSARFMAPRDNTPGNERADL